MPRREFQFTDGSSKKFWAIQLEGNSFTVHYGRIGTAGQSQEKSFADEAAAKKEHDKLVAEKTKKGYAEVQADGPSGLGLTLRDGVDATSQRFGDKGRVVDGEPKNSPAEVLYVDG